MPGVYTYTTAAKITMHKENITNQIDGDTQTFGVSRAYEAGSIRVFWNGIRQIVNVSYSELHRFIQISHQKPLII